MDVYILKIVLKKTSSTSMFIWLLPRMKLLLSKMITIYPTHMVFSMTFTLLSLGYEDFAPSPWIEVEQGLTCTQQNAV